MNRALKKLLLQILPLKFHSLPSLPSSTSSLHFCYVAMEIDNQVNNPSTAFKLFISLLFSCNLLILPHAHRGNFVAADLCLLFQVFISTVQEKAFVNLTSILVPCCSFLFGFLGDFSCYSYFFDWWSF